MISSHPAHYSEIQDSDWDVEIGALDSEIRAAAGTAQEGVSGSDWFKRGILIVWRDASKQSQNDSNVSARHKNHLPTLRTKAWTTIYLYSSP